VRAVRDRLFRSHLLPAFQMSTVRLTGLDPAGTLTVMEVGQAPTRDESAWR